MDPITMALISGGSALASGGLGYLGSQQAGRAQQQAAQTSGLYGLIAQQQAQQQAREMAEKGAAAAGDYYNRGRNDVRSQINRGIGYQEPYMSAGTGATNQLAALFGPNGEYTQQPTLAQIQMDPSYAFRQQQGEQAMNRSAAAAAGLQSGAALKAAQRFGQGLASEEYGNAYNRFMANRAAATQGLQNLAGTGASAAGVASGLRGQGASNLGTLATNAGATTAGAYTGAIPTMAALTSANPYGQAMENVGQARASSYMGGAGALGQALNTIPQNYMTYSILNRMQPAAATPTPTSGWDQFSAWRTSQGY